MRQFQALCSPVGLAISTTWCASGKNFRSTYVKCLTAVLRRGCSALLHKSEIIQRIIAIDNLAY